MTISDEMLERYLDDALPADQVRAVEAQLQRDPSAQSRLDQMRTEAERSLGSVWRTSRASCLSRPVLGQFLLGTLEPDWADYVRFHTETVGCPYCTANLEDLRGQYADRGASQARADKLFESSVGVLRSSQRGQRGSR